jgi:hypothetical protein
VALFADPLCGEELPCDADGFGSPPKLPFVEDAVHYSPRAAKSETDLLVIANATALVTDALDKGLFWNRLARSRLREVVIQRGNGSFRRAGKLVVGNYSPLST